MTEHIFQLSDLSHDDLLHLSMREMSYLSSALNLNEFQIRKLQLIVSAMREYQRQNKIKKMCINNTQYLFDLLKVLIPEHKVEIKSVIGFCADENGISITITGHLVIYVNNEYVIDPSYDIFKIEHILNSNLQVYANIIDFKNTIGDENYRVLYKEKKVMDEKKLIKDAIQFQRFAKEMNEGRFIITDRDYYDNQADFVERLQKADLCFNNFMLNHLVKRT
jgi:hypothetical protein